MDPRRRRPLMGFPREIVDDGADAAVTSMDGMLVCVTSRNGGGPRPAPPPLWPWPPLPPVPLLSIRAGIVVVMLVTGDKVTWAGAAPAGRQTRSPGTRCRLGATPLPAALDKDETDGACDDVAVGGVAVATEVRDGTGRVGGAVGESSGAGGTSPEGVAMERTDEPPVRFPVGCDGPAWPSCAPVCEAATWPVGDADAAAAAAASDACLRAASAMACASVCTGGPSVMLGPALSFAAGAAVVVEEKVCLTFERNEGRRPGSGSSLKGLGKVVRPDTGDGRDELAADAVCEVAVSMVRCVSMADMARASRQVTLDACYLGVVFVL